ncbi:MAG: DUF4091 domain-containing protein [Eubacteriales bacterium]|nr:DUF4091 domain-containing protein [Eubacteriales bacterium]
MLNFKITDSLLKLKENDDINVIREISGIKTVRNRKAAFQIVFISDENCVIRTDRSLYYRQNCANPSYRLEIDCGYIPHIYPEGFMKDDDGIAKADILLENSFCELDAGKIKAVWVDLDIPAKAADGVITVKLYRSVMFSDEVLFESRPLNVSVVGYTLPDAANFKFYLDLWQHCSNIARSHEVGLYGKRHFEILEKYAETLVYLGQKAVTVVVSEIPWSGQSCFESGIKENLYEYSMIRVTKKKNGRFSYDFSTMRKYIDICNKYGIDKEISVYGLVNIWKGKVEFGFEKPAADYPDNIRVRYYDESTDSFRFMREGTEIDGYIRAIHRYFIRTKLIEKVRVAADEPADTEAYRQSLNRLIKNAPLFKYKAAVYHIDFINNFVDVISDFVPFMSTLCGRYDDIKKHIGGDGKRMLWYVCCGPVYPNTFIRSELDETLFIALFTSFLKLDGFLRWNYTVFPDKPREHIKCGNLPAGDVNFVYPSNDGRPLLTVRYKAMRYAAELFEMLSAASVKAADGEMDQLYSMVIKEKDITKYFSPEGGILPAKDEMMSCAYSDYNSLYDKIYEILTR